jgi:hypothetical protein
MAAGRIKKEQTQENSGLAPSTLKQLSDLVGKDITIHLKENASSDAVLYGTFYGFVEEHYTLGENGKILYCIPASNVGFVFIGLEAESTMPIEVIKVRDPEKGPPTGSDESNYVSQPEFMGRKQVVPISPGIPSKLANKVEEKADEAIREKEGTDSEPERQG